MSTQELPARPPTSPPGRRTSLSPRSRVGLNAANFFLAEIVGVVLPFLGKYLGDHGWLEDEVGVALSVAGLGVFLMQTPAGFIIDHVEPAADAAGRRSLLLGLCYGADAAASRLLVGDRLAALRRRGRRRRSSGRCWGRWRSDSWGTRP